ncbi:Sorting nexinlike, partial [Caligus rogercresseyi]
EEKTDFMKEDFVPEPRVPKREDKRVQEDVFIEVKIDEPRKVGEGISSFMAYGLRTKTNSCLFTKSDPAVSRRFSDFLGLHEKLKERHTPLGRIVPPAPDKNMLSTTKAKII